MTLREEDSFEASVVQFGKAFVYIDEVGIDVFCNGPFIITAI